MRKLLTTEQFKALNLDLRSHNQQHIANYAGIYQKVIQFHPAEFFYNVSEYEGTTTFEYCVIKLKHDSLDLSLSYGEYRKKFHISCDFTKYKNITNYEISDQREKLVEPNQIGVLNAKKINDWISYYEQLDSVLKAMSDKNGNEIEAFLKSIEGLPVRWYNSNKNGEIIQNGIKFSFTIGTTYVTKNLEIYYEVPTSLESFLQLSNNQYKPVKK